MSTPLDPVQVSAIEFAREKRGVAWYMEQGLGKSLTALAEFYFLYALGDAKQMLIVCPNTFKRGWLDEIQKHGFDLDTHLFRSAKKDEAQIWVNLPIISNRPRVLVINYEAARMPQVTVALAQWAQRVPTYLVVDESIQIKGNRTAQTLAIHALAPRCQFVRLLSGKPTTQGPQDLWGQLYTIDLFKDMNYFVFRNMFCKMGGYQNKVVLGVMNAEMLAEVMTPYVFQAKKKDWLPLLPRKDYTIRDYEMSKEQARQYRQMEHQFLLILENETVTVDVAIAKWEKLAQIQTGFIYNEQGEPRELVEWQDNPRILLLRQLLEEEVSGKTVVVYRHRHVLTLLTKALKEYNPAWIKGGMTSDETAEEKDRFNTDPTCRILLAQAEASKYGHTLLGGPSEEDLCRTMIFFENSYSADTRDQIEDRIHRRGQTGAYVLYIDLSGSELDRRIVRALQRKEDLYRSVFKNLKVTEPA